VSSERLRQSTKYILSQVGGGTPTHNAFAPGSVNFAKPGGMGSSGINAYYEVPLDENLHRMNDVSLKDESLSFEKRLEVFHDDIENDIKAYILQDGDKRKLDNSDDNLRYVKLVTNPPDLSPKDKHKTPQYHMNFEALLNSARRNTEDKHPYEDDNPPTIKPSRIHTSQIYINRTLGKSPFIGIENDGVEQHPYDKAKQSLPPDGTPRSYPYRDQKEIDEYLQNPKDINFGALYGESLAFDYPQDIESSASGGTKGEVDTIKKLMLKLRGQGNSESALNAWRNQMKSSLLSGGTGKSRRMDEYFGDTRGAFQEVMGVADKFPASPEKSIGMMNWGFSSS
jgi:hypothetical protein